MKMNCERVVKLLKKHGYTLSAMEGFTGGLLISSLTCIENAIDVTEGGYITYSNSSIIDCGVKREVIEDYGYYSVEAAIAMANACKKNKKTHIGIGITSMFKGKYKDIIELEDGKSNIELTSNGPITAVYVAINTPLGENYYTIEIPTSFYDVQDCYFTQHQRNYVVETVLGILVSLLNDEDLIKEDTSIKDGEEHCKNNGILGKIDLLHNKEKKTKQILATIGVIGLGVTALVLKKRLKNRY